MTGIELIAKERQEQIEKHGHTPESDFQKYNGMYSPELTWAANAAATADLGEFPKIWPDELCNKILDKPEIERLAIAGALIAAEIDRLLYIQGNNHK